MKMVMIGIAGVLFLSFAVICVFILAIMSSSGGSANEKLNWAMGAAYVAGAPATLLLESPPVTESGVFFEMKVGFFQWGGLLAIAILGGNLFDRWTKL